MGIDVLLIAPSDSFYDKITNPKKKSTFPPLGLLYIASMLLENNFDVKVIDLNRELYMTSKIFEQLLNRYNPSLIGLSSTSCTLSGLQKIASICKKILPEVPIVTGGHFASFSHDKILHSYDCFDFIVRGDGEETLTEIMLEFEKRNQDFSSIKGISYKNKGRVYINESRPLVDDLDFFPFPRYDLISRYDYRDVHGLRISSKNIAGMLSTRGCYYRCKFCVCSVYSDFTVRSRSPENVVNELVQLNDSLGFDEFVFYDDIFTFDNNRVVEICKLIREYGLDIQWYCEGRVNHADTNMFHHMAKSGCKLMFFGIESSVDRVLRYYRKGITFQMAKDAITKARNSGIENIVGSFMFGAPIETLDDMWKTIIDANTLDIDFAQFHPLHIWRGTDLWNELAHQGLIDDSKNWRDSVVLGFDIHPEVNISQFPSLFEEFSKTFYLRRSYLFKQIARTIAYRKRLVLANIHKLRLMLQATSIGSKAKEK